MMDFMLLGGFGNGRTDERTDICICRVAFATEKDCNYNKLQCNNDTESFHFSGQ